MTAPYFRYKSRMYVNGRVIDIEPDAFDSIFMVKAEEPKPVEKKPVILMEGTVPESPTTVDAPDVQPVEPVKKERHRSLKRNDY